MTDTDTPHPALEAAGLTPWRRDRRASMTTDENTQTVTPEQVEAAARHLWASPFEHDPGDEDHAGAWEREDDWYRMLYRERAADLFRAAGFQIEVSDEGVQA